MTSRSRAGRVRAAPEAYPDAIAVSPSTVLQFRIVLTVESLLSKYALVNLVRAMPFGQHR